jgi:molybdopterin synthase catalytic subunit
MLSNFWMKVDVLYFALIRERLGKSREAIDLPDGSTAADLLERLAQAYPALSGLREAVRVAVNQEFVPPGHRLSAGDEIALIPPVSGGGGGPYCRLAQEPIAVEEVIAAVGGPGQGGVVTFSGVVRGQSHGRTVLRLEYEAYAEMALRVLGALVRSIEEARPGVRVAVVHRTGTLQVGEVAVVIAAAAPHRAEAFAACQEAIDRLKVEVPIWKKELYEGGEEWISPRP